MFTTIFFFFWRFIVGQIYNIKANTKLGENPLIFTQVIAWNENTKPDLHNINAYTKFGKKPFTFTQVILQKRKYVWMDDRRADRQTNFQHDTIIPCHYCVVGYK